MQARELSDRIGETLSRRSALRQLAIGAAAIAALAATPTKAFAAEASTNRDSIRAAKNRLICNIWCTPVDCCPEGCCSPPLYPYLARCDATCGYHYYVCMNGCNGWCDSPNC